MKINNSLKYIAVRLLVLSLFWILQNNVFGQVIEIDHEVLYCEDCLDVVPIDVDLTCCYRWEDMEGNILSYDKLRTCEVNAGLYRLLKTNGAKILKEEIWNIVPELGELILSASNHTICGELEEIRLVAETFLENKNKIEWSINIPGNTFGKSEVYVNKPGKYEVSVESVDGCKLYAYVEIFSQNEICANGIDDDCDGVIDCDDFECDYLDNFCTCEYIEILPFIEHCDCDDQVFLEVVSNSEIEKIKWDTGEEDLQIKTEGNKLYNAQVYFSNGKECQVEYDFKIEETHSDYVVIVKGEKSKSEVICDKENIVIYSPACSVEQIHLTLDGANNSICSNEQIDWYLLNNGEENHLGEGLNISINDDFSGIIDIRRCGESLFKIDKRLHSKIGEVVFLGGCSGDQFYEGQYGWDDTKQAEFRENNYYEEMKYLHPQGHDYYSPILSLLHKKTVRIRIDVDEVLKEEFERDPNFYLVIESNNTPLIIEDEMLTYSEIVDYPYVSIKSEDGTPGGNADNPHSIQVKDRCVRAIGQLKVVSGKVQKINLTIINVGLLLDEDIGDLSSGEILSHDNYKSFLDEERLNTFSMNQLFRKFKIKEKNELIITFAQYREMARGGAERFWKNLSNEYANQFSSLVNNSTGNHKDFIYFVAGFPISNGAAEGISDFAVGTFGNITKGGEGVISSIGNFDTFIHELGHGLQLCHTFKAEDGYVKPRCRGYSEMDHADNVKTCDFMSYTNNPKSFFYHHWLKRL